MLMPQFDAERTNVEHTSAEQTGAAEQTCAVEQADILAREIAYHMAYGLSHELNNPLANIASRARWLAESETDTHKKVLLEQIVDQAMRGCEMLADLMHFARPGLLQPQTVEFGSWIDPLIARVELWVRTRGLRFQIDRPTDSVAHIHVDSSALTEALWALLRNALEAARSEIGLRWHIESAPGAVTLVVNDDGPGLTPEAQAVAFHPYFSGREAGRGLGLGLSKARRIIELSGGSLQLTNGPHGGCFVKVTLPLVTQPLVSSS